LENIVVRYKYNPKASGRVMFCGLPDSGLVGKIAIDQMIDSAKPKLVADIYSTHLPPQVLISNKGVIELIGHHLYLSQKQQMFLYTGDSQPLDSDGAFALSRVVVDLARKFGVAELVVLAAMIKGSTVEHPEVFVSATSKDLAKEYVSLGAKLTSLGTVTWMHGLILGEAYKRGVKSACLSGETQGELPDPKAAEAIVKIVQKRFGFRVKAPHKKRTKTEEVLRQGPQKQEETERKREPTYIG
jgi:proteasome assembly chaperone (PAC2) family protein